MAALAARQHGVVARWQLRALGLRDPAITERVDAGRLHRVHQGVYAVGHPVLTPRGRWMAAVLAGGSGAVLSHAAAGALWELRRSAAARIDITVGRSGRAKRHGLRIHRSRALPASEVTVHDGIPVTTPARTILDLAATLQRRPLERLLDQAENARLTDVPSLVTLARAHTGHRGASKLLKTLSAHEPGRTLTRSGLEELFLTLCRDAGLPSPVSTLASSGRKSTSGSRTSVSSSRRTAGAGTRPARRSNATVAATPSTREPAGARCASRTFSSPARRIRWRPRCAPR